MINDHMPKNTKTNTVALMFISAKVVIPEIPERIYRRYHNWLGKSIPNFLMTKEQDLYLFMCLQENYITLRKKDIQPRQSSSGVITTMQLRCYFC